MQEEEYIYILALMHNCFYVGRTKHIQSRPVEHWDTGNGAKWTQLHPPVKIMAIIKATFREEEDMWTKKLMAHYSIHQVRGGSYTKKQLWFFEIYFLEQELRNSKNLCFNCGERHFNRNCPTRQLDIRIKLQQFKSRHMTQMLKFNQELYQEKPRHMLQDQWKEFQKNCLKYLANVRVQHFNCYCFRDTAQKRFVEGVISQNNDTAFSAASQQIFEGMIRNFVEGYGFELIKKKVTVNAETQLDKGMPNNSGDTQQVGMKREREYYPQEQLQKSSNPKKKVKKGEQSTQVPQGEHVERKLTGQPSFFVKIYRYITSFLYK